MYLIGIFVSGVRKITKNLSRDVSLPKVGRFSVQETLLAASCSEDISVRNVRHALLQLINPQNMS
jgi:hypothetical protein